MLPKQKTDSEIEQLVIRELRSVDAFISRELCVFCRAGIVTLKGTVEDARSSTLAQHAACRCNGVIAVLNEVVVKRANASRRSWPRARTVVSLRATKIRAGASASS
jgi:osmotically-inducible protein OsmY